ncbi:hypothetical protein CW745_13070 [Psychromonas sp. psych-6C06]|uniref:helix-turn-helix domain-containing protein n=1 Tax=Psychromonas sp. psych-6C06 TaxID=2058089 RepID=UPI000C345ED3|nr:helix-turn-helix domain-containing protein [Psychromonas sp. psych-6C06]PKF60800.1 hypothetical protein CW745_13070 [Psychromonas sp. psych-6C06]
MQRIEWVKKLADFIEETLPSICSMDQLSTYINISKAHMQRQFKMATGLSIGHYIRNRRLSRAAIEIATTDKRIIDVAMDYDFESQEAFGRAFRKLFGITPKNLKKHPALANYLSTLPLTLKYLQRFPEIQKVVPQKVTMEALHLNGLPQRYKAYQLETKTQFTHSILDMWNRFEQISADWPTQERRYFTVEGRNACSFENGEFTMMAMSTGEVNPHPELVSLDLSARDMVCFALPSSEDATEFLTYLYSAYLPDNNLHVNRMPILWELVNNSELHCYISLAQWQEGTTPKALQKLHSTLFQLPTIQGTSEHQAIPHTQHQTVQRLEYLFEYWQEQLPTLNLEANNQGTLLLLGDDLNKPFTPEFDFHSALLSISDQSTSFSLSKASYLDASLVGTLSEIAEAIEHIKYWMMPELPFYPVHGYEIIPHVKRLNSSTYQVRYLLPVKKR